MAGHPQKSFLWTKVLEELRREIDTLSKAANDAYDGATNSEVKQENKYDTRGLEASYLALGQSRRVQELKEHLENLKTLSRASTEPHESVRSASLFCLRREEGTDTWYFLLPHIGGLKIIEGNLAVQVVSLTSPLGREILGKKQADFFTFNGRECEILFLS
jgi:hypothetical protein